MPMSMRCWEIIPNAHIGNTTAEKGKHAYHTSHRVRMERRRAVIREMRSMWLADNEANTSGE